MTKAAVAALTAAAVIGILAIVMLVVAYGGVVNIAANRPHLPGVEWFLETTQEHSIERLANRVEAVPSFTPEMRKTGLHHYHQMCVTCHGAPGVERSEIGKGLNPTPPELWKEIHPPQADFWVVRNGIRMTGMPAFGVTHSDEEIWGIVAFLEELPRLSPEEYRRRVTEAGMTLESGGHGHGGGEDHHGQAQPRETGREESATSDHTHAPGAQPHQH